MPSIYDENPFPGPRHYDERSIAYCVERKDLAEDLTADIRLELLTVVFGPSGSGKSSILCGTVRRKLREENLPSLYYNKWRPGDSLEMIQCDLLQALADDLPELTLALETRQRILCLPGEEPKSAHDVVLIFDQLDHLFSPGFSESERKKILAWLIKISSRRFGQYHGNVKVVFGVRDDHLGLLLSSLAEKNQFPKCYFKIPRLKLSELLSTAFKVMPEWEEKDKLLRIQLKDTYINKDTSETDPEINAPLAQMVLYERFADGKLREEGVSFATVIRNYFISKTKGLAGAAGSKKASSFFRTFAQKFVSGKQKKFCSEAELADGDTELRNAMPDLIAANLITAVGAGANRTYTLTHDALCEIITSQSVKAAALAEADAVGEAVRDDERKTADVYSQATKSAIVGMKEMSDAGLNLAQRHSTQLADVLTAGHERELASLRQAQKEQVANLNQLHLAALERERAAGELAQRELEQAHKREQEQLKQFHSSQLAQLRQQHVSEVEGVSRALGQKVADTQVESERRASEQQRVREEIERQLAQEKTERSGVETQLGREQTERSQVERQLSQVQRQLSQVETSRALVESELSKTRRGKAETEKALTSEQQTSAKQGSLLRWGGLSAVVMLTSATGTAGYGLMRTQTLQTTLQVEQVGRKEESAKCKADEASCQALSQAERRVALAQCLLQKRCGPEGLPGNPNRAASLLREIPAGLHSRLPLWSVTAKQILQRGRLQVAELPTGKGEFQGIVYSQTGELLAFFRPDTGNQHVLAVQDEGAAKSQD